MPAPRGHRASRRRPRRSTLSARAVSPPRSDPGAAFGVLPTLKPITLQSGSDGWDVAFYGDNVYITPHHTTGRVLCYVKATGASCGSFPLGSNFFTSGVPAPGSTATPDSCGRPVSRRQPKTSLHPSGESSCNVSTWNSPISTSPARRTPFHSDRLSPRLPRTWPARRWSSMGRSTSSTWPRPRVQQPTPTRRACWPVGTPSAAPIALILRTGSLPSTWETGTTGPRDTAQPRQTSIPPFGCRTDRCTYRTRRCR